MAEGWEPKPSSIPLSKVKLGAKNGTGDLVLSDSWNNYSFFEIRSAYYESGWPAYGLILVPTISLSNTTDNTYSFIITDTVSTGSSFVQIGFIRPNTLRIIENPRNRYVVVFGII